MHYFELVINFHTPFKIQWKQYTVHILCLYGTEYVFVRCVPLFRAYVFRDLIRRNSSVRRE